MNENGLSRLQLRRVRHRLPRGQGAHRHRCGFGKVKRFRFRGYFPLLDRDVLGPATSEGRVTINCITRFKVCHFRASFLHDAGDVVTRNQRQMGPELPSVLATEGERIGWIDATRNYAHERFIFLGLRPRHFFELQQLRRAILVRDYRFHHPLFVRAYVVNGENYQKRDKFHSAADTTASTAYTNQI